MSARVRKHSVSSTKTYETCPRQWLFKYHQRVKVDVPTPWHWRFGTVVHKALEAAFRARAAHTSRDSADVDTMFHPRYRAAAGAALERAWADDSVVASVIAAAVLSVAVPPFAAGYAVTDAKESTARQTYVSSMWTTASICSQ